MNMKNLFKIFTLLFLSAIFISCKGKNEKIANLDANTYYTCPMDPQVVESKPGICPICHMTLVPARKSIEQKNDNELNLSPQQMQLGNIQVDTIRNTFIGNQLVLTGIINFDQTKMNAVSARLAGRIEKLYFKKTGDYVSKGDPLYEIYSEELNNAKQEYLLAVLKKASLGNSIVNFDDIISAAKNKLQLWGLNEQQIKNINSSTVQNPRTTVYSSASGYVTEISLQEGDYVAEGGTIIKLADLSTLWVEAQVYATQMAQVDDRKVATITIPDYSSKKISGTISFENPELNPTTRINLIRIRISNTDNKLKPGMAAYIRVETNGTNALALPIDAVLQDGKMSMVWLQTSQNKFKSVMVETGNESGSTIEIKTGIQPGDVVVTSGAYLLQSEYIFRKGASPMAGMKM
jgi:membrane fusion protein, copper/silver efflux system